MTSNDSFGSGELTPELVRGAQFTEVDGHIDATEVRTFLDRVASALDVFLSADAQEALRKEFARNAGIAQQVLDAGQNAAEQLRHQAADDAKRILDETREATDRLKQDVERELEGSKRQVIEMRTRLMGDLRDLHDRIGASLYRFERAIEESPVELDTSSAETSAAPSTTPSEPQAAPTPTATPAPVPAPAPADPAPELAPIPTFEPIEVAPDVDIPDVAAPAGAPEPAWTQLPSDAWTETPETGAVPELAPIPEDDTIDLAPNPFAVVEDEPLAPGEPLIDLREFGAEPIGDTSDDERAAALLANLQEPQHVAPATAAAPIPEPAPAHEAVPAPAAAPPEASLPVEPLAPAPTQPPADPAPVPDASGGWLAAEYDDPLGSLGSGGDALAPQPGAAPAAVTPPAAGAAASPDAMAVRQLILESISAGQSRQAIEAYLRDNMGFVEPGVLVDAALASMQPGA